MEQNSYPKIYTEQDLNKTLLEAIKIDAELMAQIISRQLSEKPEQDISGYCRMSEDVCWYYNRCGMEKAIHIGALFQQLNLDSVFKEKCLELHRSYVKEVESRNTQSKTDEQFRS